MSSHWRSSRWSSAREREEQDRARHAGTTTPRPSGSRNRRTTTPAPTTTARPASDIGTLISSSRERSRTRTRKWPYPEATTTTAAPTTPAPSRRRGSASRRTTTPRPVAAATAGSGDAGLPPLPDEPGGSGGDRGGVPPRLLVIGAVLFVVMALLLINPGDFIPGTGDGDDGNRTPTAESMIVPTTVNTRIPDDVSSQSTSEAGGSQSNAATREEVVCIDAGHGGWDPGFVHEPTDRAPYLEEADINLAMSYMLKERLEAEGFTVVLTRPSGSAVNIFNQDVNGDTRVAQDVARDSNDPDGNRDDLQARINICNEAGADLLISLHINGYTDTSVRGYEVLYTAEREFGQQNVDLAFTLYDALTAAYTEVGFDSPGRSAKADTEMGDTVTGEGRVEDHFIMTGPAVNAAEFSIVPSAMPGAIVECAFISNDADAAFLADPANQEVIVDAYLRGILDYFEQYPGKFQR
jgi:N-acetylmuramoyl-L-alanine amidase